MFIFKAINLGLRFFLELTALWIFCYWGFHTGKNGFVKLGLGVGSPLIIAIIWGLFGSPAAPYQLSGVVKLLLELAILH
ncbi:YrdB family protein [Litchfieldia alkalitelluris]|uniref:YrdB family protein n=1 Tax=Litchfieldia alkalitelluris TaxID=304268 RepID=UPI00147272A9|nr:YrdB family protein [Litchfieldia alkalitelluris]